MKHCHFIKKLYQFILIPKYMMVAACLFSLFFFFNACIEEMAVNNKSNRDYYEIQLGPVFDGLGESETGSVSDNTIKEFRILVFDLTGDCKENVYVSDITGNIPVKLSISGGTYDFVFIANEGSDNPLSSQLNSFTTGKTLAELTGLNFDSSAFGQGKNIPMSHLQRNVEIGDEKYIIEGIEYPNTTIWKVPLQRLGIRIDLRIKTASAIKQKSFTGVEIFNLPQSVPILEKDNSGNTLYNGGSGNYETTSRTFTASSADNGGFQKVGDAYEWVLTDIILPSSLFNPDSSDAAITFKANYSDRESELAVLEDQGGLEHQAPRNTWFVVNATILPSHMEVHVKAKPWEDVRYDTHLVTKVKLNLSDIHLRISEYNRGKVLFTCNQPEVYIEDRTTAGELVDDIFYGLVGNDAYNFYYEYDEITEKGYGYFDLTIDRVKPLLSAKQEKSVTITLNASGVKRSIDVDMIVAPIVFAKYDYVGAFWRNDEIGERLISMKNGDNAWWTVDVIEGQDWIVVDNKKSLDPNLFTNNPGDAELYPVDSERTYLSGYGNVFFRIGLTSTNPGTAPRYGVIKIERGENGYQPVNLYVRQGEEADYVMRPEDTNASGGWVGANGSAVPRPLAGKFSPFNLTAQQYLEGTNSGGTSMTSFPQLAVKGGKFTTYPTQAGAFFTFAATSYPRVAMHPFNYSGNLTGWETNSSNSVWSALVATHETCPSGYRRMSAGKIGDRYTSAPATNVSEMNQSLFLNPPTSGYITNSPDNNLFGYYADGFFDRRLIEDAGGMNAHLGDVAVAATSNDIAYAGRLFYNPYNNASLFFPAAGQRLENSGSGSTGRLMYAGYIGHYWTSTPGSASAHSLDISNGTGSNSAGTGGSLSRCNGFSIRCVKDE